MSKILTIARVFVHQDGEGTFPKWEHGKILSSFKGKNLQSCCKDISRIGIADFRSIELIRGRRARISAVK